MNRDVLDEKDMLELLNYLGMDEKEKEDAVDLKMDDLRKKRLRRNLLKQVKGKDNIRKFKYKIAAIAVIAITSICASMPVLAKNIPVLNSIIQAINGTNKYDYGQYEKYSKVIDKSVTDKGIMLTINEVLCDDSTLMIGYTIKSEGNIKDIVKTGKDLIEIQGKDNSFAPFTLAQYLKTNGEQTHSESWSNGEYLDEHTYINSETMNISNQNLPSIFNIDLNVKNIWGIEGNWNFKFSISKEDTLKATKIFKPNITAKFPDAIINVEKISFSPINTSIILNVKYNKDEYKDSKKRKEAFNQEVIMGNMLYDQWFVLDDKGNNIAFRGFSGHEIKNSSSKDFWYELKFVSLRDIPKYLTVIPYRRIINNENNGKLIPPIYRSIDGVYPIELSQGKMGKLIIKKIKTEKDKTIVRYTAEGQAPFYQAEHLYMLDEKDQVVERKDNNFDAKRDTNNPKDYIAEFEPLDKNTKYKIGTNDLGMDEIRNDLKFRIDLSNK